MIKFVSYKGRLYRLLMEVEGFAWVSDWKKNGAPIRIGNTSELIQENFPEEFLDETIPSKKREATMESRLKIIEPLIDEPIFICNPTLRSKKILEISKAHGISSKTVTRFYFAYLTKGKRGLLPAKRTQSDKKSESSYIDEDMQKAIKKYYYSPKKLSLYGAYEMYLLDYWKGENGRLQKGYPDFARFQRNYRKIKNGYRGIISRQGIGDYQKNYRPLLGSANDRAPNCGTFEMDATEADICIVSKYSRKPIGRPVVYLAVDVATRLIITAKKDATGAQVKGLDNALNMTGDSEEKAGKLQEMHKEDPNVFNKPEVKNWMGENQLGLDKDKQALVDAGYNPESGEMSGIVATDKGNGKVALDKVSDLESTRSGAGNERAINAQQSSLSAERAKAGEAQRAGDFTGSKTNGADAATFGYTDANGVQHTAHLERTNSADAANGEFRMRTDSGETATVSAPKDMSATDVAGVINGSASSDVKGAYSEFQNQAGPYSKASETSASTAASNLGVDTNAGGSVAAAMSGGQTAGSSGRDFATFNYTDKDGVQHTAQMERLDTPSSDHSEFKMVLDDGREPVINAPKDASAHDVASMVNGTASTSVQDSFSNYHADGPGIINAQAATNVDASRGGAVMSGTAFENSPNTVATISGASGESAVSLERIERGTASGGNDVWSATKDGVEIGRMEVAKDTGAAEVMSRVMNDTSDDFASVRSNAGLDTDNPYVSFSRSSSPAGPEPMHCDIEPNAPGTRTNGSTWHSFGEVGFGTDDSGHEQVSFNYNAQGDHGLFTPASAKITDTGLEVFSEVSGPDKDGIIDIAATGKVYDISGEGINGGSVRVVVDNKASVEDIASAVLAGGGAASSISGVENIREAMGITETMNPGSESTLKRFFNAARNKSRTNNKDNPVDAE